MSEDYKKYVNTNKPWLRFSLHNGYIHGEFKRFFMHDIVENHFFKINGVTHGEHRSYREDGQIRRIAFYFKGKEKRIPILPIKPSRLPHKSNRTRLDTLEI